MYASEQVSSEAVGSVLRRAYAGDDLVLDRDSHSLHDLTQIAIALKPGAKLVIRRADLMSPLERASIATVGQGHIVFD